jgi:hypothetical protein
MIASGIAIPVACTNNPTEEAEQEWISLFNGRDLTGWTPKFAGYPVGENYRNTFRVKDGILQVSYAEYESFNGEFGHLFFQDSFSHYRLRVEYRFIGEQTPGGPSWGLRNSGIMIHGQPPVSMDLDQRFPVSIEVQLLGGNGVEERPNANLCTPGTHVEMQGKLITQHCTNSSSPTFHGDQWVLVEVEVRGGEIIRHHVNGNVVLTYENPQLDGDDKDAKKLITAGAEILLTGGTISLQAESHPLEFRRIELRPLK